MAGGADLIKIETQHDVDESCAAVRAAKAVSSLPVICSFAFNLKGRTMMGLKPERAAQEAAAQASAAQAEFQIRLMAEPQDRDHIEVDYVALETATGQVHLPLHRRVICTGEDVVSATLQENEYGLSVLIALTEDGGEHLRRATGGNLGKQLGLLYRGQLVAAPTIRDEISRSVIILGSGPSWPETARSMVETLGGDTR